MHYCENGCDAEVNDAGYCPQCGHRNNGYGLEEDGDDYELCRICGAERCSQDCCWLCLHCEIDTADDGDGVYCQPCANHLEAE